MILELILYILAFVTWAYSIFWAVCSSKEVDALNERLSGIAALETPKGSATSKKMAGIARGEL